MMVFKLSEQLDNVGDPNLPFQMYQSYIESNAHKFPESALQILNTEKWTGGSSSQAPYYSELQNIEILNLGKPNAAIKLNLKKEEYVKTPFNIELIYEGLFQLDISGQDLISENPLVWRYEEFLFFDPYRSYELKDKMFTHKIEWVSGAVWSITARELKAEWKNS